MTAPGLTVDSTVRVVRRHSRLVGLAALCGLTAGLAYTVATPPLYAATSQVVLPGAPVPASGGVARDVETDVRIAQSATVLQRAADDAGVDLPLADLRGRVRVGAVTTDILAVEARAETADGARALADAVADAYVAYAWSTDASAATAAATSPSATARVLEYSPDAVSPATLSRLVVWGLLGALAGAATAVLALLFALRHDRRLRLRDEIADALGLPVLASLHGSSPADAGEWLHLLREYRPPPADAWSLRNALRVLGPVEGRTQASIAVVSLADDDRALAVGPQLAAFAAARGIRTTLVVSTQHQAAASLRTACSSAAAEVLAPCLDARVDDRPVVDDHAAERTLTVLVDVADGETATPLDPGGTTAVVAVTAGMATAADLARVGVGLADAGGDVVGVLVADPDPEDRTTGRVPAAARPAPVAALVRRAGDPARAGRR